MRKKQVLSEAGRIYTGQPLAFEFVMEANEKKEVLVDAYIGVEFSIIYELSISINKSGKPLKHSEKFYCQVPGSGIDSKVGKQDVAKDFRITPDNLEASTTKTVPRFLFEGQIYSVNCSFNEAFDGFVVIRETEFLIKSIEV